MSERVGGECTSRSRLLVVGRSRSFGSVMAVWRVSVVTTLRTNMFEHAWIPLRCLNCTPRYTFITSTMSMQIVTHLDERSQGYWSTLPSNLIALKRLVIEMSRTVSSFATA